MSTTTGSFLLGLNDFEMGGLDKDRHSIIAYGVRVLDSETLEVLRSDEFKVLPEFPVDPEAARVNGYTEEGWQDALTQKEGLERYRDFLGDVVQFAAWRVELDRGFLDAACARTGVKVPLNRFSIDLTAMAWEVSRRVGIRCEPFRLDNISIELGLLPEPLPHLPLQGVDQALMVWRKLRESGEIRYEFV